MLRVGVRTDRPDGFVATALRSHPGLDLRVLGPDAPFDGRLDLLFVEALPVGAWPDVPRVVLLGLDAPELGVTEGRPIRPGRSY